MIVEPTFLEQHKSYFVELPSKLLNYRSSKPFIYTINSVGFYWPHIYCDKQLTTG